MSKIRKYYSETTKRLVSAYPAWSAIYSNPVSNGQRLLNLIALEYDEIINKFDNLYKQQSIYTANIDEIYETWVCEAQDIVTNLTDYGSDELFEQASGYYGYYPTYSTNGSGTLLIGDLVAREIELVDPDDEEYFYKHKPTAYKYTKIFEGPEEQLYYNCQYLNGVLRVHTNEIGLEKSLRFPRTIDSYNSNNLEVVTSEGLEPNFQFGIEENTGYINSHSNYRPEYQMILDSVVIFKEGTTTEEQPADITVPSGFYFVGSGVTSDYYTITKPWEANNTTFRNDLDYDKDGIVNEAEYYMLLANLGRSRYENDMTDEIWEEDFSKFDLNDNDEIDNDDLRELSKYIETTIDDSRNIIHFNEGGYYIINYNSIEGGGISGYTIVNDQLYTWRNDSIGDSLEIQSSSGYRDIAYDSMTDVFYFTNNDEKSVVAQVYDELGNITDSYKIQLPVTSMNEELGGIASTRDGIIYVVSSDPDNMVGKLYSIDTHSDDVRAVEDLNAYATIDNREKFYISSGYLPYGSYGVSSFQGDKLIVTSLNDIYLLDPLYDVAMYSSATNRVHFRSWHQQYGTDEFRIEPVWNRVWNEFDELGLIKGLTRLPGENNEQFKLRILEVNEYYPYNNEQGYINGITRDIGVERFDKATDARILTLKNAPLDPNYYEFSVISSMVTYTVLSHNRIVEESVYNDAQVELYKKYHFYGTDVTNGIEDTLLYTLDGSVVIVYISLQPQYGDSVRVTYQYLDDDGALRTADEILEITGVMPEPEVPLEIFRISNLERFGKTKYGYFNDTGVPTSKLSILITELRQKDNTTFYNYKANISRYDTWQPQFSGENAIPSYWQ